MSRTGRSPLVGREGELRLLREAIATTEGGTASTILVAGDAGVGKTRLLDEAAVLARDRGWTVLTGSCVETAESLPYVAVVDALHGVEASPGGLDTLRREIAARPALGRLLPHIAATSEGDLGEGLAQVQLFDGVHGVLRAVAETAPLLVLLEDLHWADRSTRDLIAFLDRTLRSTRVLTVLSYRSDDLHRRHPLRPFLAELARRPDLVRIGLEPLTLADSVALAEARAGRPLAPASLADMHRRSEGNPFFLEALVDADRRTGERPIPDELADVLITRVDGLPDATAGVLRAASVGGRRIDLPLLSRVLDSGEPACEAALAEALAAGLLYVDGNGYSFRHALVQEAIASDLLPGEGVRLHGAFARELAERWGEAAGPFAGSIARHRLAAFDLPGALRASVNAAEYAESVAAPAEALEHLETALSLIGPTSAQLDQLALLERATAAASVAGEPERAVEFARAAAEFADAHAEPEEQARAKARLAIMMLETEIDISKSCALAEAAVGRYPAGPPARGRAYVLAVAARTALTLPVEDQIERLDAAIAEADACHADDYAAESLITRARLIRFGRLPAVEGNPYQRALDLVPGMTAPATRLRALRLRATELFEDGSNSEAMMLTREGLDLARATGLSWSGYGLDLRLLEGWLLQAAGDWDEVLAVSREAGIPPGGLGQVVATLELQILVFRGDPAAESLLARLRVSLSDLYAEAQLYLSEMELSLLAGENARATEVAARPLAVLLANGGGTEAHLLSRGIVEAAANEAVAARLAGDLDAAARQVTLAEAATAAAEASTTTRLASVHGTVVERALVLRTRAELARALGSPVEAVTAWRAAAEGAALAGRRYDTAVASWRLGEALLATGARGQETVAALASALETARRTGAQPLLDRVTSVARQGRLAGELRLGTPPPDSVLTPRELDVLRLVSDGLSNRAIGAALFISEKTASVHVSNIMAKTGTSSRAEAAAAARKAGLLG